MTVILLPMPPSSNSLFAGKARRHLSDEYKAWREEAGWELKRQKPLPCPGKVSLLIEVAEPKTNRATDLGNREKAVTDLLVEHGIIEGDSQHFVRRIVLEWSDKIEGVRITLEPWEKSNVHSV